MSFDSTSSKMFEYENYEKLKDEVTKELIKYNDDAYKLVETIDNTRSLVKIYDLIIHDVIYVPDPNNMSIECHLLGRYHQHKEEYKLMKTNYLTAIHNNNMCSAYLLGHYYQFKKKKYDKMKMYYDIVIDNADIKSYIYNVVMLFLGVYHGNNDRDNRQRNINFDQAIKYYSSVLCDHDDLFSVSNNMLGCCYVYHMRDNRNEYLKLAKKHFYVSLSCTYTNSLTMMNLAYYYCIKNKPNNITKFYLMAHKYEHPEAMDKLIEYMTANNTNYGIPEYEPECLPHKVLFMIHLPNSRLIIHHKSIICRRCQMNQYHSTCLYHHQNHSNCYHQNQNHHNNHFDQMCLLHKSILFAPENILSLLVYFAILFV